jgi:Predicted membrane protein
MAEMVAVAFDNEQEADRVLTELNRLQKEYLVDLVDAVIAVRPREGKVQLKQSINMVGLRAASGAVSGSL